MTLTMDKQYMVYAVGLILGLLIGAAFYQNQEIAEGYSLIGFGTAQLIFLIGNYMIFGKYLDRSYVGIFGILSMITCFLGTSLIDQLIFSIIYGGIIAIVLLGIYLQAGAIPQRT